MKRKITWVQPLIAPIYKSRMDGWMDILWGQESEEQIEPSIAHYVK